MSLGAGRELLRSNGMLKGRKHSAAVWRSGTATGVDGLMVVAVTGVGQGAGAAVSAGLGDGCRGSGLGCGGVGMMASRADTGIVDASAEGWSWRDGSADTAATGGDGGTNRLCCQTDAEATAIIVPTAAKLMASQSGASSPAT